MLTQPHGNGTGSGQWFSHVDKDKIDFAAVLKEQYLRPYWLLFGPEQGVLSDSDLDWARGVIRGLVRKQQERIPIVKEVIVTRFHPLVLHSDIEVDCPLPTFD